MLSCVLLSCAMAATGTPAIAQAAAGGSLEGVVRDSRGLALPGVTVSLSGAEIVGGRTATTDENGSFRFPALSPGSYTIGCALLGYQASERNGVVVSAGQAVTLEFALAPAALVPPSPGPTGLPVVEVKVGGAAATLDSRALYDVPSAANQWAVLDGSPGVQMRGYDVGGSHKALQTPYDTFGIRGQNRIVNDGVNTTEGTGGAGGYYDYFSVDEFQVTGHAAGVEMSTPGVQVVTRWKQGTNAFSGVIQGGFENTDLTRSNIDAGLEARGATPARLREYYDYHLGLGGPIVKDRAWFYVAHDRVFLDRAVSGHDPDVATEIGDFDTLTGKLTVRPSSRDQLIGFGHWSFKQQPNRGLSANVSPESVLAQESTTRLFKLEWQRTWSDRLSSSILVGYFGYDWDLVPIVDPVALPPRLDTATGLQSGAGWAPFRSSRWKPQSTGRISYRLPTERAGSHELTLGWDWQIDRNGPAWSDASGAIRYLDNSAFGRSTTITDVFVDRLLFANVPNQGGTDHNRHTDLFAQDTWRAGDRLNLTLGVRAGQQSVYYSDVANDPLASDIFSATSATGSQVFSRWGIAPRLGAAFDLSGRGRSVLKAYFGRFYANVGSGLEDANPGGRSTRTYEFLDLNQNGVYDGVQDLGRLLDASGGNVARFDPDFKLAYSDEFSAAFEQELATDLGLRLALVHKRYRNWWDANVNLAQTLNLTNEVTTTCSGCPGELEGSPLRLLTIPDDQQDLVDPRIANVPLLATTGGENTDMTFTTWQVALVRRFRDNLSLNASFDKQLRSELRAPGAPASAATPDPLEQRWFQNHSLDVANRQETTYWTAKLLARYVAPYEIGLALNVRFQSGFPWAPVHRLLVPNVGTRAILLSDMKENRSEDVTVVDLRLDKSWRFGNHYRFTGTADVYNLLNANTVTSFVVDTGSRFENVIEWLPGLTVKLGLRLEF